MNCLTVCEPFAEMIACGQKRIENRRWRPPQSAIGAPLLIHAGANVELYRDQILDWRHKNGRTVRVRCIVAQCVLADVIRLSPPSHPRRPSEIEALCQHPALCGAPEQHDYAEGPWCWVLSDVQKLNIPFMQGQRGLYDVDRAAAEAAAPAILEKLDLQAEADMDKCEARRNHSHKLRERGLFSSMQTLRQTQKLFEKVERWEALRKAEQGGAK